MSSEITPLRLDLKKDKQLDIDWQDGKHCTYTLSLLRTMCPCAQCKMVREGTDPHDISPAPKKKPLLTILPGNFSEEIKVVDALPRTPSMKVSRVELLELFAADVTSRTA